MRGEGDLKDVEIDDEGTGLNHEQLFCCLYSMESDGSFVAVAYAGIPIIVCQIFNDEFLTNIYHL